MHRSATRRTQTCVRLYTEAEARPSLNDVDTVRPDKSCTGRKLSTMGDVPLTAFCSKLLSWLSCILMKISVNEMSWVDEQTIYYKTRSQRLLVLLSVVDLQIFWHNCKNTWVYAIRILFKSSLWRTIIILFILWCNVKPPHYIFSLFENINSSPNGGGGVGGVEGCM